MLIICYRSIMEQSNSRAYESQIQAIKAIENNLQRLKSRLQYLYHEQNRTNQNFQKIIQQSVPLVKRKLIQCQHQHKSQQEQNRQQEFKKSKIQQIKNSKMSNEQELQKSRYMIQKQRFNGSFHIRQMSRKNQQIIQSAKRESIDKKKKKSELVRLSEQQSRRKINQFHCQKQKQLRKRYQEQKMLLQRRINKISKQHTELVMAEQLEIKKIQKNKTLINNTKIILKKLQKMKPDQFNQILGQLNSLPSSRKQQDISPNQKMVQKIILKINQKMLKENQPGQNRGQQKQNKKSMQNQNRVYENNKLSNQQIIFGKSNQNQSKYRFSIQQGAKGWKRNKSQSIDVQTIYGERNPPRRKK